MKVIIAILMILGGFTLGLWLGVWVLFIGGVVDIIEQIKAPNLDSMIIAWGLVKIVFASIVGWVSALLLIIPAFAMLED